ncbi:MAG: glycosyltransferase family 2 protein [Deltaproteobacteria bacterium]|nr:glycosyltransferase family 2 protein [Deltaproteobacteria bacterium]
MLKRNIAILIVAFNEEEAIGDLLLQIPREFHVYVIDDGSTDRTGSIAREKGAKVIRLPINLGQGAAAIVGYKIVAMEGHDFIVKMDGDGQHDPKEIYKFIEELEVSGVDTVVGSRLLGKNYRGAPLMRKIFLKPVNLILSKLTGYKFTDSMCGFRAFRGTSLKKLIPVFDKIVEPEYMASEMWIRFSEAAISVSEIPIHLKARRKGISYKGFFRYGWGILQTIIRTKLDIFRS